MIQENVSLKKYNTFGIDVLARQFAIFRSIAELQEIMNAGAKVNGAISNPLILGGGSNILFTRNVDGLVMKNEIGGMEKLKEDDDHVYVKVGAGENWHGFVMYCLDHDYAGVENLALIPGNAGASPMQNIGAYGVEIKDVFHSLEAYDLLENKMQVFDKAACAFGYRESVFKHKFKGRFVISSVTYRLLKKPVYHVSYGAIEAELEKIKVTELSIRAIAQAVINIRSSKLPDPKQIGNAGSFFKNPEVTAHQFEQLQQDFPGIVGYKLDNGNVKLAAGWLIENCGWKGYRKGDAGCHEKQALVLVNYGHATGSEIYSLSTAIVDSVYSKFHVQLEREVNIL